MKYGVMAMLFAVVAEAQEFADFDTEISTTSLVQEGENFARVRLNSLGSLRDLREQSALAVGVSSRFEDLGALSDEGNENVAVSLRLGELAVVLEPALAGRLGGLDLRGVLGLGIACETKPAGIGLKLTAATRFDL